MVITRKAIGDNHFFSRPRHVVISLAPAVPGAAALDDHIVSFATANLLLGNDVVTVTSVVADEAQKAACEAALAGPMAKLHAFQASYSEHESKPKCELHVFAGNAAEIVMSCVKSAKPRVDLLVCGTRGHTGVKKLFLGEWWIHTAPRGRGGGTDDGGTKGPPPSCLSRRRPARSALSGHPESEPPLRGSAPRSGTAGGQDG